MTDKEQITVRLLWFSVLAEHRGTREERISLPAGTTANDLQRTLAADFPKLAEYDGQVRLALNQEFADEDTPLQDGDEIAFLTPVSGG